LRRNKVVNCGGKGILDVVVGWKLSHKFVFKHLTIAAAVMPNLVVAIYGL
jgi:hypothetical protein